MNRAPNILNPKTAQTMNYWHSLNPKQRLSIMRQVTRTTRSETYWLREIIKAIENG